MNKTSIALAALMVTASIGAMAETTTSTTRDQRMDAALQDYHSGQTATNSNRMSTSKSSSNMTAGTSQAGEGRFARAEDSVKSGSKRAGHAVAEGSRDVGHAVAQGARKTGHAVHNGADKATGKTPDSTSP